MEINYTLFDKPQAYMKHKFTIRISVQNQNSGDFVSQNRHWAIIWWTCFYENNIISTDPINSRQSECLWLKVIQSVVPTGRKLLFSSSYWCCECENEKQMFICLQHESHIFFWPKFFFLPFSSHFMEISGDGQIKW